FHQVHFSAIKGISHLAFVSLLPIYTSVAILSMVGSGVALDRFGTQKMLPFYQLPLVIGFIVFATGQGIPAMALAFALVALTAGSNSTLPNAFWADAYGTAHIGSIKAMATAVMVLGSALGPFLTGILIDFGVGLETQYIGVAVYFLFTTALLYHGVTRYFVGQTA
ncbi:MAG: MFS transporter, partial [Paracoccaceae bacterium]